MPLLALFVMDKSALRASSIAMLFWRGSAKFPGIGAWTARYVAMRALGEPDAFPPGDLGLIRALGLANSRQLKKRAEAWRPWRAYACMYLWSIPNQGRGHQKEALPATRNAVSKPPGQRVPSTI